MSARDQECSKCHKKGHFGKVCRSTVTVTYDASDSQPFMASIVASSRTFKNTIEPVTINGIIAKALINSGSDESYLHPDLAKKADLNISKSFRTIGMASASLTMKTTGNCVANVCLENELYNNVKFSVLPGLCTFMILGLDFKSSHESVTISYGGSRPPLTICGLSNIGVEPHQLFANLTADCHLVAVKSRKYSSDGKKFIHFEATRLPKEGIITPSNFPWRAQVLVTNGDNHKKRMVIDYSATINNFTQLDAYPVPNRNELLNKVAQHRVFSTINLKSAYHQVRICKSEQMYTAFEADGGLYEFTRIPFGVTNGVTCFQRVIDRIIQEEGLQGVYPYLDDVAVCGKTAEDHDYNLDLFRKAIQKRGITVSDDKCVFSAMKNIYA